MAERKELNFFLGPEPESRYGDNSLPRDEYLRYFADAPENSPAGEVSTGYFSDPHAPARIHAANPDARIIISLRDPIERAFSNYRSFLRAGYLEGTFREELESELESDRRDTTPPHRFISHGRYATHLERYLEWFRPEQIHVLLLDDMQQEPIVALKRLFRFLGVSPDAAGQIQTDVVHNFAGRPRNRLAKWSLESRIVSRASRIILPLRFRLYIGNRILRKEDPAQSPSPDCVDLLSPIYEPEIDRLEQMLGRPLDALRKHTR